MSAKKYRIVWAVDPLGEERSFQASAAGLLKMIAGRLDAEVYPVYLYGGYPLEFPVYSPPVVTDSTRREMGENLKEILKGTEIEGLKDLEILIQPYVTLHEGVDLFVDRANALKADLILSTTHARKGVTRWLIGSFAEALTEKSTVPVLIVNPETGSKWDLSAAVFATDFSEESKKAFSRFLPLARALKARVCLYHKMTHLVTPRLEPAFSSDSPDWERFEERAGKWRKKGEEWARIAAQADISVQVEIDSRLPKTPADAAIEEAEKRQAWIAIAAQSKPIAAALLGSTARRIIRSSGVPVWVYRSHQGGAE